MIQIRPIVQSEASTYLQLLCNVFALDYERASVVFFTEPLYDLNRKWALFDGDRMASILTTTALPFGWGHAIGIAGVATDPEFQGRGYANKLLLHVLAAAGAAGEGVALLFAHRKELYERVGFRVIDEVVRGTICGDPDYTHASEITYDDVVPAYGAWAAQSPSRLARDELRWQYWKWGYRVCEKAPGGYVCFEGTTVREAVLPPGLAAWPVPPGTEWWGLQSLTEELEVPLASARAELTLLAHGLGDKHVRLFMTDQF